MLKKTIITFVKISIALGLIYWMIVSGKLDLSLISKIIKYPQTLIISLLLLTLNLCLGSFRWSLLINDQLDKKINYYNILKINWIGYFFNMFLPGSVSGDFIKLIYIKKHEPKVKKRFLITSVIIDRIVGLCGLILIVGFVNFGNLITFSKHSYYLKSLILFNYFMVVGVIIFLSIIFISKDRQEMIKNIIIKIPIIGKKIEMFFEQLWLIGSNKTLISTCGLLSVAGQSCFLLAFWIICIPFYENIPVSFFFEIAPVGFISMAVPITPAGIGIGHLVFDKLFKLYSLDNGASVFNIFFVLTISLNLLGIIPYIFNNVSYKKINLFDESKLEEELNLNNES
jgi:glycosyltransferase 2 family protein